MSSAGCDSNQDVSAPDQDELSNFIHTSVEEFSIETAPTKSGENQFVARLQFRDGLSSLRLPAGINILARRSGTSNVVIYDDGMGVDEHANDGTYTGLIPEGCVPPALPQNAAYGKRVEVTCTFEFVGPGSECGEFGECPERVKRSLLWGLIEYETDILFCVCIVECEVTSD